MNQTFGYPETNNTRAASVASKTRRLPNGRYEAVAALFFEGRRLSQFHTTAENRHAAQKEALRLAHTGGRAR